MGMTIEQKIKTLLELYHYIKGDTHFCGYTEENTTQSLETAIETMRKYQKIQEIIGDWEKSGEEDDPMNIIDNIEEVIEDGKID